MTSNWYNGILLGVLRAHEEGSLGKWISRNALCVYVTHELDSDLLESTKIVLRITPYYIYIDTGDGGIHRVKESEHETYYLSHYIVNEIEEAIQDRT